MHAASRYAGWACAVVLLALAGHAARAADAPAAAPAPAAATPPAAASPPAPAPKAEPLPTRIEVYPPRVVLETPRREMHLVVSGHYTDGTVRDLTAEARFAPSAPDVVRVDGQRCLPVANGRTELVIAAGGQQARVPVEVRGQETPERVSFVYGAEVALTKQGCNQGACHGSPSGKGGFRLSLRAYDPELDLLTLVREGFNRRTNVFDPAQSLLLRKPLMEVAHGGGKRLSLSDPSYALLRDWIAEGCQADPADQPTCVGVEVYPRVRTLHAPAWRQQLVVLAKFSDGSLRDVTRLASFSSSDEGVASVTDAGLVTGSERGAAAILVRYLENMQTASLTFLRDVPGFRWPNPPESNYIDREVFAQLRTLQFVPSELSSDAEFVRRVHLDVLGMLPTSDEVREFLADTRPDKRARLIDALLGRPEYAEFWGQKWADLLRVKKDKVSAAGVPKFHRWLVSAVRENLPYDEFARQLLLAEGSTYATPPANYYRATTDSADCTETTTQLFLGVRMQCAKCHNHPFERWTQDNYYGITAFFQRVQRKKTADPDELVVFVARQGEVTQPRTGKTMKPWLPLVGDAELPADADRREAFVQWLTGPENPFFARVEVNRIWGHLLGRGIVEPVDDFRESNPPTNPALLDALAADFIRHGFDRKHVLRTILNSRTYQLSSRKHDLNRTDTKYFSHARARMLSAEQLLDAICLVTGVAEKFPGLPSGMRAAALPSPDVNHEFLKVFGQPARESACACERSSDSNLSQALQMINGPLVHGKLRDPGNRFRGWLADKQPLDQIVRELYLSALSREPSAGELDAALKHIASSGDDPARGLEDVCWALLNANEFLFQH